MTDAPATYRFYDDLAGWWPLISPPEEYAEEAAYTASLIATAAVPVREVLECTHHQGDMRTVRLGRRFDAVLVHDAVDYMVTEADLRLAVATAFAHCRPGGVAVFVPDATRETYVDDTDHGGHDGPDGRAVRFLDWTWDPDPTDSWVLTEYAFLLREPDGTVRSVHETHRLGLFGAEEWLAMLSGAGFAPRGVTEETSEDRTPRQIFVAHRPSPEPGTDDEFRRRRPSTPGCPMSDPRSATMSNLDLEPAARRMAALIGGVSDEMLLRRWARGRSGGALRAGGRRARRCAPARPCAGDDRPRPGLDRSLMPVRVWAPCRVLRPVVVAHRFEQEADGVEPEGGVIGGRVLREVLRLVDHLVAPSHRRRVHRADDGPGRHHERHVLETDPVARVIARLLSLVQEEVGPALPVGGAVGQLGGAGEEGLEAERREQGVVVGPRCGEVGNVQAEVSEHPPILPRRPPDGQGVDAGAVSRSPRRTGRRGRPR